MFILTDDLAVADMEQLPELRERFTTHGTRFDRAFVSLSMCCPSRAATLRGQYAHNTGIRRNGAPDGGYGTFRDRGPESSTIATWLHDAGYRTGLFGKYLNGYPNKRDPLEERQHERSGGRHTLAPCAYRWRSASAADAKTAAFYG